MKRKPRTKWKTLNENIKKDMKKSGRKLKKYFELFDNS